MSNDTPTDHDKITKFETILPLICRKLDRIENKIDKQQDVCACRIDQCNKHFLRTRTFWGTMTFLAMLITGMLGYTFDAHNKISAHEKEAAALMHHENHD